VQQVQQAALENSSQSSAYSVVVEDILPYPLADVSVAPSAVSMRGGVTAYITGPYLNGTLYLLVNETVVHFDVMSLQEYRNDNLVVNKSSVQQRRLLNYDADENTYVLSFEVPAVNRTAADYSIVQMVVYTPIPEPNTIEVLEFDKMLFYAFDNCLGSGTFNPSGGSDECFSCPEGATCPGGGRAYPAPGYWSLNEFSRPSRCAVAEACPGYEGLGETQVCSEGYEGVVCSQCSSNHFRDGARCRTCGTDAEDEADLALRLAAAVLMFLVLILGVAFLPHKGMPMFAQIVVFLQMIAIGGQMAAQELQGTPWLSDIFSYLSVFNFDIDMVKPGCAVPMFSHLQLYYISVTVCTIALLLASLSAFCREVVAPVVKAKYNRVTLDSTEWKKLFRAYYQVMKLVALVVSYVIYLRIATITFQTLNCSVIDGFDGLRLVVDRDVICFEGDHILGTLAAVLILVLFLIGCPLGLSMVTARQLADDHTRKELASSSSSSLKAKNQQVQFYMNFIQSGFFDNRFLFAFAPYVINFAIAASIAFSAQAAVRIFVRATALIMEYIAILTLLPYKQKKQYWIKTAAIVAVVTLDLVMLGALSSATDTLNGQSNLALTICFAGMMVVLGSVFALTYKKWHIKFVNSQLAHHLELQNHADELTDKYMLDTRFSRSRSVSGSMVIAVVERLPPAYDSSSGEVDESAEKPTTRKTGWSVDDFVTVHTDPTQATKQPKEEANDAVEIQVTVEQRSISLPNRPEGLDDTL
jgi:hypothetical protein